MPTSFRDSPAKRIVRESWDTPILEHLHNRYNCKFRYLGFPGTDLIDVQLWSHMIQEVVAFELQAPGDDSRAYVKEIRQNLRTLGLPGVAYFGSFEEVVILRKDYDGQEYKQNEVVTLYNLDFCDEIASQIQTRDSGTQTWRFEALRAILHDQHECQRNEAKPSHFVILLTVRNQINASKIRSFLAQSSLLADAKRYQTVCERVNRIPTRNRPLIGTHTWAMKTFMYNLICNYFSAHNINALFFPLVKYLGTPIRLGRGVLLESPMLHWVILCKFGPPHQATPTFCPPNFLAQATSIHSDNGRLLWQAEPGEMRAPQDSPSIVTWFERYVEQFI